MRRTSPEHTPSTVAFHLLPAISLRGLSGEQRHSMGLAAAYGPFLPAVYHPFVLREAGWAPQKGLPEHGLSKEPKISQRIVRRDGGPVQGRRPCTQPSRQPTAGGNAQSKGSSSRPI